MAEYENNAYFWQKVDTLFLSSDLKHSRKKGETHPQFKNLVYPVDYGRLVDVTPEVSVYLGSGSRTLITGLVVAADILQKTLDVKILAGCTEEETDAVLRFLNQTDYQKTVLIRRRSQIPGWGLTDN
ncbi:MAG: Inorganic pyrophosphatase [Erysipelotrichaceae bacterium]|nr:Inorganic pyrophosphatase [Erysipelotrichaceae bacterium]